MDALLSFGHHDLKAPGSGKSTPGSKPTVASGKPALIAWTSACGQLLNERNVTDLFNPGTAAERGITITRVFDGPRHILWKEWTEPARFADWFGGPDTEVPLSTVAIDLRPGGVWTATTLSYGPDRRDVRWHGEYLEIVEPARLVFTICGLQGEEAVDQVTVLFADLGSGRTYMLLRQRGQRPAEQYELARQRWLVEFDRIAQRIVNQDLPIR